MQKENKWTLTALHMKVFSQLPLPPPLLMQNCDSRIIRELYFENIGLHGNEGRRKKTIQLQLLESSDEDESLQGKKVVFLWINSRSHRAVTSAAMDQQQYSNKDPRTTCRSRESHAQKCLQQEPRHGQSLVLNQLRVGQNQSVLSLFMQTR